MTKAYIFKGKQYLRHTIGTGADSGYPKDLAQWHSFLANGVDAAVNWGVINGNPLKAYFFKGNEYLRWTIGEGADAGYPRPLSGWHPFLANGVDAAVNWGLVNGKSRAYFFKGSEYLRWTIGEGADAGYPRQLSNWHPFLAQGVDAAVNWGVVDGKPKAYFFKGNQYLRWTIGQGADTGYPRPLSNWNSFVANGVSAGVNWTSSPTIAITDEASVEMLRRLIDDGKPLTVLFEGPGAAKIIDAGVLKSKYEPPSSTAFAMGIGETIVAVTAILAIVGISALFIYALKEIFETAVEKGYRLDVQWGMGRWNILTMSFDMPFVEFDLIPPS